MSNFDDSSTLQLPNYTPSAPLPSYTHELASGERRLQHSPRSNTRYPSSVFIRKSRKATVVLSDQEDGVAIPTFGRTSVISGSISLNDRHNILNVQAYVSHFIHLSLGTLVYPACRSRVNLRRLIPMLVVVHIHY